jgi:hypothetical protein
MIELNIVKLVGRISIESLVEDTSAESPIISVGHHGEEFIYVTPVRNQNEKKEAKGWWMCTIWPSLSGDDRCRSTLVSPII